jgi:hypothetical protein
MLHCLFIKANAGFKLTDDDNSINIRRMLPRANSEHSPLMGRKV